MANRVLASLRYRDARGATEFLERAFGFELTDSHEDGGRIAHVQMRWGESTIMFGAETDQGIERFGPHAGQRGPTSGRRCRRPSCPGGGGRRR